MRTFYKLLSLYALDRKGFPFILVVFPMNPHRYRDKTYSDETVYGWMWSEIFLQHWDIQFCSLGLWRRKCIPEMDGKIIREYPALQISHIEGDDFLLENSITGELGAPKISPKG